MRSSTGAGASRRIPLLRLGRYFGTTAQFWLDLRSQYDLDVARDGVVGQIEAIVPSRRRGRTFVAGTYFSPILLNSALRRMGEKYVHVGKVRGCSTPSGRREKRARRTPGRLCPKTVVWRTSATPVRWEEGGLDSAHAQAVFGPGGWRAGDFPRLSARTGSVRAGRLARR